MAGNTLAAEPLSSKGGKTDGQINQDASPSVFWFPVYEGLFEHAPIIKDAVWFFMWLIARTTREQDGSGSILGGAPIHDGHPAGELGFPIKTVRRWRRMLVSGGYISVIRTPYGFRYTLLKSKKWQRRTVRELPKLPISSSESGQIGQRECPQREERVPETGVSKKTIQGQHREEAEEEAASAASAASPSGETKTKPHPSWKDIGLKPCGTPKFLREWEDVYDTESEDDLVDLMEIAIQRCQAQGIPVPPPFYQAKRRMEAEAKSDDFPTHPVPGDEPEFDHEAYAKKLNDELEARWVKEGKPLPSHPIPD